MSRAATSVMHEAGRREDLARSPARSGHVDAAGVNLHVLAYPGSGVDVLVLPGITSPAITWEFVARELMSEATVYVLDLRGRGLSDVPEWGYTLPDYAADVTAVVRELGLERPVLLGHSLGARIAAAAAASHPGLTRGLILIDPPLSGPGRDPYPTTLEAFQRQLREAQAGTTVHELRGHYPGWPVSELELRARWLPTCGEAAVAETHRCFETDDFLDSWTRLRPPLALLYGAESPVVTAAGVRELEAANPHATTISIAGAGHMVPWDNFEACIGHLRRLVSTFASQAYPAK
jgi:N-formylmaleamate deformylase